MQELDNKGAVEFWYSSGFISRDTYKGLLKHCNFSATGELVQGWSLWRGILDQLWWGILGAKR